MRALVLSGGGSLGAYQVGAVRRLVEAGRRWGLFCGVSIGAINGAYLAMHPEAEATEAAEGLANLWRSIETCHVWRRWFPFGMAHGLWRPSLVNSEPLAELVKREFSAARVVEAGNKLRIGACTPTTGTYRVFDETYPELAKAILASSAFPLFLTPVELDGSLYLDGGIEHATPLRAAVEADADAIDVVLTEPAEFRLAPTELQDVIDIAPRVLAIMAHTIFEADIKAAIRNNQLARFGVTGKREIEINVYRPRVPLGGPDGMTFDATATKTRIDLGYADTNAALEV